MPLVFACIAPHGFPIIPELSADAEGALETRAAMEELGRRCASTKPEALVLAGPHGIRVEGTVCLVDVARAAGVLHWNGATVEMNVPIAMDLTAEIADAARDAGIPIALAAYAGNRRDQSAVPLDWGAMTPLWFLGHGRNLTGLGNVLATPPAEDIGPPVVLVTPSRALPRETMVEFGRAVARVAVGTSQRVGFVASCDWAHTHREDGPYGFHAAATEVDRQVVAAIEAEDLDSLVSLDDGLVRDGAIDGLWQVLMLAGLLGEAPMRGELLSYEAPSYYGMIVAAYS
ncbi:MAG: aromatic ring-opening dioxygenase subunit LigB [Chloroflexota bacterium]|nr:aromatic ring-opening dioxygenase subunit LigB [Chloroflexota bacterium]